jgi:ferredoxin-NADP reductase
MTATEPPAGLAVPGAWRVATVIAVQPETPTAKTFRLRLPSPSHHLAGQHYLVRLTAPDGYTASRSYSVASPPDGSSEIELTVERLPDGEVSTFLHDDLMPGDDLEVRGPIGGWFIWRGDTPALLIGGGSGVVPLRAMLCLARDQHRSDLVRLLVSVRRPEDLYYSKELPGPETTVIYTRQAPPGSERPPGRLALADIPAIPEDATVYVCGSESFSEAATDLLMSSGILPDRVRIEKFGPSG